MSKTKILESYFNLLDNGVEVDINSLPDGISKEVVYKMTLYKELKKLVASGTNIARQEEIKAILNPPQKEGDDL